MSSPRLPQVSVVMPCFNSAQTLCQAVDSVIAQSFAGWELIVVDDGSTDECPDILSQYAASDERIRIFKNERPSGASGARNRGLKEVSGRYIAFLDSDDYWLPHKLETQINAMRQHAAGLACSAFDVIDGKGRLIGDVRPNPGPLTYRSMLRYNSVGCLTAMLDREFCGDIRFNPELTKNEDYQLWLSVLRRGAKGICLGEKLAVYRLHEKTLSSNKFSAARNRWRVYREFERFGLLASVFLFLIYGLTGIWKSLSIRRGRFAWS